jgi:hypothetical protein
MKSDKEVEREITKKFEYRSRVWNDLITDITPHLSEQAKMDLLNQCISAQWMEGFDELDPDLIEAYEKYQLMMVLAR